MYYHTRFQQKEDVKRVELKGRFSFIHLGGGNFVYTIPGKNKPKVGRIDLSELSLKKIGIGFTVLFVGFFLFFVVLTKSGVATTNETKKYASKDALNEQEQLDLKHLDPQEIEKKSEELKNKVLQEDNEIEKALQNKKTKYIEYKVKEGDNLILIATKYRVPVKFILKENNLKLTDYIYPGQTLKIPNKPGIFYKIKKGDRLITIAEKYKVSVLDIIKDNDDLKNFDILIVGKKIFLPNAVIPEPPPVWQMPIWGRISSYYGYRLHPIYRYKQFHDGIDIAAHYQPVQAARDGIVYFAGYMGGYGKVIILKHGRDFKTLYAHLSEIYVRVGQMIKAGKIIGKSGNTGFSTGPHLHFEILYKGSPVNPIKYLKRQ
ncbi:MAG: peptidase M23 [Leptospiraceae bacterium]|nr:MAG: peptidase M23 [Leptospiraceae bacterium]